MYKLYVIISFCIFCAVSAQDITTHCDRQEKCNDCISQPGCVWCDKPNINIHCKLESTIRKSTWCIGYNITNPKRSVTVEKNDKLNSGRDGKAVQITPQVIKIRTRRGEETTITFQYAKAANYPIDLYYVMDLSASMKKHKKRLAELGEQLAEVMKNITSNFRLGFGSFVDKTRMPFTNTAPKNFASPCTGCVPTYSYKNHLSLTEDYKQFAMRVAEATVSGNMDAPEGGFDALMQAIVCKKQIGWRENATHLIVYSSDAEFHVAGDGKLAGVIEPNDGTCHMVNDEYIGALDFDYPSVSQLNQVAKENNVNIIFAVEGRFYGAYQSLQQNFENSGVGVLDSQSSNVVKLVIDNYKKIAAAVRIADNATSSIEIKYKSTCKNSIGNGCLNLKLDEIVNFTAIVKPLECLPGSNIHKIQIKPEGVNEALIVEVEVVCSCDCGNLTSSLKCNIHGDEVCGVCECHQGYFGRTCECDAETATTTDDLNCRKDPKLPEICSGFGSCKCGKCVCDERPGDQMIYGKFCECDNFSCERINGEVCNGPDHGKCSCGNCTCLPGWKGNACNCRDTTATCMGPTSNGKICSGHGNCICGECQCIADENKYSGRYCEECASCPGKWCEELQECVECQAYQTGFDKETCLGNCTEFKTILTEVIDVDVNDENTKICTVIDSVGCTITFTYSFLDEQRVKVSALKKKVDCPVPIDPLGKIIIIERRKNVAAYLYFFVYFEVYIFIVIGSIVLGGLILLVIWKIVTHIHDGREYARFLSDAQESKWNREENPIFRPAESTFQNPAFKSS
ncbi:integrin beta subunit [Holotrichia oblita]|uniref:Integrin beta subunit n=1 Tax=Holotrichia oblita TaxID=644536 RepID=A0ACB9TD36_HOLOL|nr:integrin beta subunit [Holotrichia oblita]